MMKKILLLITFLFSIFSWGQLSEGFETGLPTAYSATTSYTLSSGTWTGQANGVIRGTTGVQSGSYSLQLRSQTGSNVVTPNITSGVGVVSFYGSSSTTSGAIQVNYSIDGGATWLAAPGSPFSLTTGSPVLFSTTINNVSPNILVQFYRTAATVYIDDVNITSFTSGKVSVTSGDWNVASTWTPVGVPSATDNVTISTGHTVYTTSTLTRNANTTVNGTFELRTGGWATGTGTFTYNATTGGLNFNLSSGSYGVNNTDVYWPTTNGPFNVSVLNNGMNLNAGANRVVNGTFSIANSGLSNISFPSATLTINGICRINAGGAFANSPIYGIASTLNYNTGTTYGRGIEWSQNGVGTIGTTPGYPNNVQLSSNTTLNYTNGIPLNKAMAGNLTIDSGSSFYMDFGGGNCNGFLTVAGNVINNGNFTLGNGAGDDLKIGGNFTNTGTFNGNGRAIFFTKNGTQTVSSTTALTIPYVVFQPVSGNTTVQLLSNVTVSAPAAGNAISFNSASDVFDLNNRLLTIGTSGIANVISGLGTFKGSLTSNMTLLGTGSIGTLRFTSGSEFLGNLILNRQAGVIGLNLGTDLTLNGSLLLTNGILDTSNRTLSIASTASIVNSSTNYIIADLTAGGALRKYFSTTGSFTFPVGDRVASADGTQYSPATINFTTGTFSSGYVSISVEDSKEPNNEAPTDFITRYWNLTSSGITSATYNFSGTYLPVDINGVEANSKSGRLRVSNTTWLEGANITSGSNLVSLTGMDTSINALTSAGGYNYTAGSPFRRAEINIQQSGTDVLTGATYNFGTQSIGTPTNIVFTIQNLGLENLNLSAATVVGGGAYTLSTNYTTPVSANGTTTFVITFNPTAAATFTGSISIPNNDTTGSENPYVINFTGVGQCLLVDFEGASKGAYAADEVLLNGKYWLLSEALIGGIVGQDYFNGLQSVRMRADVNGFIEMLEDQNVGISDIIFNYRRYNVDAITASFVVEYSKDLGNSWIQLGSPIVPTATVQTFNQSLNQSGPVRVRIRYFSGTTSTSHRINIDDIQLCNYTNIREIEVFGNATTIQNTSTVTTLANSTLFTNDYFIGDGTITRTYTIKNVGTGTLTLSNPTISGASEFTIGTALSSTSLTAGQSATFSINFAATTAGLKTATVSLVNNDSNENPFTFNVETNVNDYLRCTLGTLGIIAQQDFEVSPATPTLGFAGSGGTFASTGGTAYGNNRTTTSNKFIGARSYQVTGSTTNSLTFSTIDVSNFHNISFSFKVGAYANTIAQGMESGDLFKVSVSIDGGTTWVEQVRIRGNNNSIYDINTATGSGINHTYDATLNSYASFGCTNNSTNTFSNTIKISSLPNSSQLRVKIDFNFNTSGASDEIWAIDNVKIEGQAPNTKTWNAGWTPAGAPTVNDKVIIDGTYVTGTNGNLLGCECQINSGKILTVSDGNFVEIQSDIKNEGTLNIADNGSLIQINDFAQNTGAGIVSVDRIATIKRNDYVYWSTPINVNGIGNAVTSISSGTPLSKIWKWIPTQSGGIYGTWANTTENMEVGKGYIVRGPSSHSLTVASDHIANFTGKQNNGIINVPIERGNYTGVPYAGPYGTVTNEDDNWNLIGNPYPSAIDAIKFLQLNTNIDGNVRIWTHGSDALQANPNPFYANFGYNYSAGDYATYNVSGTNTGPSFSGKIASAQGFFVTMNDGPGDNTQTVIFKNDMRNKSYNNSQFFKSSVANSTVSNNIERNRIWIDLLASTGEISRTLVGYIEGATMAKDRLYDASIYPTSLYLYSLINNEPQTIQGRSLPFDTTDTVPMGMYIETAGNYTIAISAADGLFSDVNQDIYLEDKLLNVIHDLRQAPYTFSSVAGEFNERFVLRYTNTVLSNQQFENSNGLVIVSNNQISLSASENIQSITVFDLLGRTIYSKENIDATQITLEGIQKSKAALIVKTTFENGIVVTNKILF